MAGLRVRFLEGLRLRVQWFLTADFGSTVILRQSDECLQSMESDLVRGRHHSSICVCRHENKSFKRRTSCRCGSRLTDQSQAAVLVLEGSIRAI